MTTTAVAPPVTGQDINIAARAVRGLLEDLLAEAGTSFPPLATLNTFVAHGGSSPRESLVREVGAGLDVDSSTVQALLRHLQSRGLVRETRPDGEAVYIELTPDGEAEHRRLRAIVGAATAELYRGFDADELATTRRVLVTVTERVAAQRR